MGVASQDQPRKKQESKGSRGRKEEGKETLVVQARPRDLWIFGYGSLVWRPAFRHQERRPAWVRGYRRRFWQGSTDHRGRPQAPGRVATLVQESGPAVSRCWGMAYRIGPNEAPGVLAQLDHRERGGYDRVGVGLHFEAGSTARLQRVAGVMYIATQDNPDYLGPAPLDEIARQVMASHGPSGANREYVLELAAALLRAHPGLDERTEDALALARLIAAGPVSERPS